jgi:hypothetical protein
VIEASVRIDIARHHALLFIDKGIKEYSQWFEGKSNQVADALSREFERPDENSLTFFVHFSPLSFQVISV